MPLYDTLGPDAVEYIVGHAEVTIIFASALKLPALVKPVRAAGGKVTAVVFWGEIDTLAKMVRAQGLLPDSSSQVCQQTSACPVMCLTVAGQGTAHASNPCMHFE